MRTRVFDSATASELWQYLWQPLNGAPGYSNTTESHVTLRRSGIMMDVVTTEFQKKRNEGQIINSPMYREDLAYTYLPVVIKQVDWRNTSGAYGILKRAIFAPTEIPNATPLLPNTVDFEMFFDVYSSWRDLAVTRAWAKVELSEAMLLASLGELPETLGWMRSVLQRGVNLTKKFRSKAQLLRNLPDLAKVIMGKGGPALTKLARPSARRVTKAADSVSEFANLWLEYRYAIRPLIFEYKQCLEALAKVIKKGSRKTARGKELNRTSTTNSTTITDTTWYSANQVWSKTETAVSDVSVRAGVLFDIGDDIDALLAVWGIDQPLESVYELIPFSFILDWFFSVGDVISSWSVNPSLRPLCSWVTFDSQAKVDVSTTSYQLVGKNTYTYSSPQIEQGHSTLQYRRRWRLPSPTRTIVPRFDLKLDLAKIIDLGLIGRSLLSGKTPKYQKGA